MLIKKIFDLQRRDGNNGDQDNIWNTILNLNLSNKKQNFEICDINM